MYTYIYIVCVIYIQSTPSIKSYCLSAALGVSMPIKSSQVISIPWATGSTDSSWRLPFSLLSWKRQGRLLTGFIFMCRWWWRKVRVSWVHLQAFGLCSGRHKCFCSPSCDHFSLILSILLFQTLPGTCLLLLFSPASQCLLLSLSFLFFAISIQCHCSEPPQPALVSLPC